MSSAPSLSSFGKVARLERQDADVASRCKPVVDAILALVDRLDSEPQTTTLAQEIV